MNNSILTSVKKLLGLTEDYTYFDADIIMHINMAFMVLYQLGVGTSAPFSIEDKTAVWSDFVGDAQDLNGVKTYVYLKVKQVFDPPQSSAAAEAIKQSIAELEWRLNVTSDPRYTFTVDQNANNAISIANRLAINSFRCSAIDASEDEENSNG